MLYKLALPANQKANEGDLAGAIKYATLVNGEWTWASNLTSMISFIRGIADTIEALPPRFHQTINDNVAQSFNDAFENHIPAALQNMIQTTITNALAAALPPLLAPINGTLTRMETKLTRMETKLTRVEIMQAKVSVSIHNICYTFVSNCKL